MFRHFFPLTKGCSEGLDAFRFFFKQHHETGMYVCMYVCMYSHRSSIIQVTGYLKKSLSASRPYEYPPVKVKKTSKRLGGIMDFIFIFKSHL